MVLRVPYPHRHRWSRRAGLFAAFLRVPAVPHACGSLAVYLQAPSKSVNVLRGSRKPDGDLQEGNNNQSELLPSVSPR